MDGDAELRAWLALLRAPQLAPGAVREALDEAGRDAGLALARLRADPRLPRAASAWLRQPDEARLRADLAWLARPGHRLLRVTDADFPPQLVPQVQAPVALFVAGDAALLLRPQVAIVGARAASGAGLAHAARFARALVHAGFVVTSGLADGIDGAAHRAALDAGGVTVAVLGTGADVVYPRKHVALAARIAEQGALVSEFPPGTPARPDHFPRRNRILAGLTLGTLVIEAGLRSGSLITARLAAECGREVFALPGSIDHALARGCHRLLRDGAHLVEEAAEVRDALVPAARALGIELAACLAADAAAGGDPGDGSGDGSHDGGQDESAGAHGDAEERAAARLLRGLGHDPATLDELVARTGLAPAVVGAQLSLLELEAKVGRLAGNRFQRLPAIRRG